MKGYNSIIFTSEKFTRRQKDIIFWAAVAAFFAFLAFTWFVTVPWIQDEMAHQECLRNCHNNITILIDGTIRNETNPCGC